MPTKFVPNGYSEVARHFDVERVTTDDATGPDLQVEFENRIYHFSERIIGHGEYRLLDGLLLQRVEERNGDRVDHGHLGTDRLPPELLRCLVGATYQYVPADGQPTAQDRRVITEMVWQSDDTAMAVLAPGDGVLAPVAAILRDVADGRIEFVTFRRADS